MEKDLIQWHDGKIKYNQNELYDIDLPVLYILGLSEEINSVEQLAEIRNSFAESGYRTALVSDSKDIAAFGDCYCLPMFSGECEPGLDQRAKTIQANHYLKDLEVKGNYELLIIGIMKGTGSYGRKIIEDFGIHAYCLSKAARPDCVLLNVFYGTYDQEILDQIGRSTANIIESDIDFYNIVNEIVDVSESEYQHKVCTRKIDSQLVENRVENMEEGKVFYLVKKDQIKTFTDAVTEKLAEYAEIIKM